LTQLSGVRAMGDLTLKGGEKRTEGKENSQERLSSRISVGKDKEIKELKNLPAKKACG